MNKICTSLEQSKKLIELGIDTSTADMWYGVTYKKIGREDDDFGESIEYTELSKYPDIKENAYTKNGSPAWSLTALLNIAPEISLNSFKDGKWNAMVQHNGKMIYADKDNPIDACVEMIIRLKEMKLL